jgi:hypothetical protein
MKKTFSSNSSWVFRLKFTILTIFVLFLISLGWFPKLIFHSTVVATVTDKTVKRTNNDNDRYLIFTEDETGSVLVLEDTDSLIPLKFNSSDIYAQIDVGQTYRFDVRGLRIRFLSMYQNIYGLEEVKDDDSE